MGCTVKPGVTRSNSRIPDHEVDTGEFWPRVSTRSGRSCRRGTSSRAGHRHRYRSTNADIDAGGQQRIVRIGTV